MRTNESREVVVETVVMDDVATEGEVGSDAALQVTEGLRSCEGTAESDFIWCGSTLYKSNDSSQIEEW